MSKKLVSIPNRGTMVANGGGNVIARELDIRDTDENFRTIKEFVEADLGLRWSKNMEWLTLRFNDERKIFDNHSVIRVKLTSDSVHSWVREKAKALNVEPATAVVSERSDYRWPISFLKTAISEFANELFKSVEKVESLTGVRQLELPLDFKGE